MKKSKQPNLNKKKIPNTLIANMCGFTSQYVGQLLSGKRKNPESLKKVTIAQTKLQEAMSTIINNIKYEYNIKMPKKKVA